MMRDKTVDQTLDSIKTYLNNDIHLPFFVTCDESTEYKSLKSKLQLVQNIKTIRLSDYCRDKDTRPLLDNFYEEIEQSQQSLVVLGLGEYLPFLGESEIKRHLGKLKDLSLNSKAVFLCRNLQHFLKSQQTKDPRFDNRRVVFMSPSQYSLPTFTRYPVNYTEQISEGFKILLRDYEEDKNTTKIKTVLRFPSPCLQLTQVSDSYSAIKQFDISLGIPFDCGTEEQWNELLLQLNNNSSNTISQFLQTKKFDVRSSEQFRKQCFSSSSSPFEWWLYFIALKYELQKIQNPYLKIVVENTSSENDLQDKIMNDILKYSHKENNFHSLYEARKELLQGNRFYSKTKIIEFIQKVEYKGYERIYYLTDNTKAEQQAVIECIAQNQQIELEVLQIVFPNLANYLQNVSFRDDELATYFQEYKEQKLYGIVKPDFLQKVTQYAVSRPYNVLTPRNELVSKMDQTTTYLYSVDALGVEFLGLIQTICEQLGLNVQIEIGRADLPTITSFNKSFYINWKSEKQECNKLDGIKHTGIGKKTKYALHLANEIDIIIEILEEIATILRSKQEQIDKVVVTSDHGASFLVVANGQELKYEVLSKGEHNGRCCKDCKLPNNNSVISNTTIENGYLVLADYNRFSGSRAAMVEVHGGATLEEVIVPVITISLGKKSEIEVIVVSNEILYNPKHPAELMLQFTALPKDVFVKIGGKKFDGKPSDANHYVQRFILNGLRAGKYTADI
ncbi:MAG: BREX-4 system phosphatase PglZ, partial [Prevotellaceae bacterium]|nr:BREX-4 system phosphatase PglZ [Prevotellaceae bacterium]